MNQRDDTNDPSGRRALQRVEECEIQLAHQQKLVDELNQVVIQLSRQLDQADRRLLSLGSDQQQMKAAMDQYGSGAPDERPPHY